VTDGGAFNNCLEETDVDLVVVNSRDYPESIAEVVGVTRALRASVPVIGLGKDVSEAQIEAAMAEGAVDLVSLETRHRLQAVLLRELRNLRIERAFNSSKTSTSEYRRRLRDFMDAASFAVADIQEGIVINCNDAWLKLFGYAETDDVIGLPIMDSFDGTCQTAVKGALTASMKGRWQDGEKLEAKIIDTRDSVIDVALEFSLLTDEFDQFVQIKIVPGENEQDETVLKAQKALQLDPTTLFLHRSAFLEDLGNRLEQKPDSGIHLLVFIKPDRYQDVQKAVGILQSEQILGQFADIIRGELEPNDIAGRFEGTSIMALLERGSERDAGRWAERLVEKIGKQIFEAGGNSTQMSCSVGICPHSGIYSTMDELVTAVVEAYDKAAESGGSAVFVNDEVDNDTKIRQHDEIWVRYIKSALLDDRFRIVQLPIAGLRSNAENMYDVLVRMIDEQDNQVLPSEFLPAAERNNLSKTIDRWVLDAAVDFCKSTKADKVFIRLSRQSVEDDGLIDWIKELINKSGINARQLVIQLAEQDIVRVLKPVTSLFANLRRIGVGTAIEHFGFDNGRVQMLNAIRPDYVKLDGQLMHSLTEDIDLQNKVREIVKSASDLQILTIAERVENANTMAVLFQVGVHFMQGHYVHEPEVVLQ
jgi:EAL domain-containing protein (putative c-di-GMP-specific phosphodiesterase class I)/GGDEF domain-containing protein